jgi:hypothetical protein
MTLRRSLRSYFPAHIHINFHRSDQSWRKTGASWSESAHVLTVEKALKTMGKRAQSSIIKEMRSVRTGGVGQSDSGAASEHDSELDVFKGEGIT